MNSNMDQAGPEGTRIGFLATILIVAVLVVGGGVFFWKKSRSTEPPAQTAQADEPIPTPKPPPKKHAAESTEPAPETTAPSVVPSSTPTVAARTPTPAQAVPTTPKVEPSSYTRSLVTSLSELDLKTGSLTPEKLEVWKQNLATLKQQGTAALPAILEYMDKNLDLSFEAAGVATNLGAASLRMALLETITSIGGPEGLNASLQVLQTTADPKELAYLARSVDTQAPEQYREAILNAARSTLRMADAGNLPGRDVGPLFNVIQQYAGANSVPELEGLMGKYRYYAPIALADLPNGAGVPSLINMATDAKNPNQTARNAVLPLLAEVAYQSPEAKNTLISLASQGAVPYAQWVSIASVLGGSKYYIGNPSTEGGGNQPGDQSWHLPSVSQNFYTRVNPNLTPEQINQNLNILTEVLAATRDPAAQELLQRSMAQLQGRLGK